MRQIAAAAALAWVLATPALYEPAIPYFSHVRDLAVAVPARQNYVVVDQPLWAHARPNLEDVRLYDGQAQVPYVLKEQRGGISSVEEPARILNLGSVAGHTEFDLEIGSVPEYNRIRLQLDAQNFVASAKVEGRDEPGQDRGTQLGKSTLYDFTQENLGSNSTLQLPVSSFRYLRVSLSSGVRPDQVKGAQISSFETRKSAWLRIGGSPGGIRTAARQTVQLWPVPAEVPVDRIHFQVAPKEENFRREVHVTDAEGTGATGEISRIHRTRGGMTIVSENLDVDLPGFRTTNITISVDNRDDPPLKNLAMQPLSVERRIYFDPAGKGTLRLYSGDEKLATPNYNYAEFFREDPAAAEAQLGPDQHNPAYTGRPDDRPWSERHPTVLWLAMLIAVMVLAALAIRGFKTGTPASS